MLTVQQQCPIMNFQRIMLRLAVARLRAPIIRLLPSLKWHTEAALRMVSGLLIFSIFP